MALVSLGQAAKLAGLGKTTLARAIKAGRATATSSAGSQAGFRGVSGVRWPVARRLTPPVAILAQVGDLLAHQGPGRPQRLNFAGQGRAGRVARRQVHPPRRVHRTGRVRGGSQRVNPLQLADIDLISPVVAPGRAETRWLRSTG
jgi:hypothetical protein